MSGNIFTSISLDNENSNITYASNGSTTLGEAWTFRENVISSQQLYNNTESLSYQPGATATLRFYGTALDYWSNTNNDHGSCELVMDGDVIGTVSSFSAVLGPPAILYSVSNLTLGMHSFMIMVEPATGRFGCEIDRFVVNATITAASVETPHSSQSDGNSSPSPARPSAAIITGSLVGAVALISIIVIALIFILRFRFRRRLESSRKKVIDEAVNAPPISPGQTLPGGTAESTNHSLPSYSPIGSSQPLISGRLSSTGEPMREVHTVASLPGLSSNWQDDLYPRGYVATPPSSQHHS